MEIWTPLDGTFRICNKKMLLFILIGVDENCESVSSTFISHGRIIAIGWSKEICKNIPI